MRDGEEILLADEAEAFAAASIRLLTSPPLGEAVEDCLAARLIGRRLG